MGWRIDSFRFGGCAGFAAVGRVLGAKSGMIDDWFRSTCGVGLFREWANGEVVVVKVCDVLRNTREVGWWIQGKPRF